jgi:AraC-like DNA-binding protein
MNPAHPAVRSQAAPFDLIFASRVEPFPGKVTENEGNDHWLMEYVESGYGELRVDGAAYDLAPGELYLVPPDTPYGFTADKRTPWVKQYIIFRGEVAEHLLEDYSLAPIRRFPRTPEAETCFAALLGPECGEPVLVFHSLLLALHRSVRRSLLLSQQTGAGIDEDPVLPGEFAELRAFALKNLGRRLGVADLASRCNLSPSQLTRRMRVGLGISPHRWLMELRFQRASEKVRFTHEKFKILAAELGFSDEYSFSAFFKSCSGHSPRAYRRLHGGY